MESVSPKIKQWIDEGKDPRIAHWQAGLEAALAVFLPFLEPGKLTPVQALEEEELPVFARALETIDLSPNLQAAFLPASIAGKIAPPASVEKLQRLDGASRSLKILIQRAGEEKRILCIELSDQAKTPGVDIFQAGALLGTYDFENQADCFEALNKIVRTHIWEKDKWPREDHIRYTVHWFERVLDLPDGKVCVEKDHSFLHSPTLIRSNGIDAVFTLVFEVFVKHATDAEHPLAAAVAAIASGPDRGIRQARFQRLAESRVFEYLTAIKKCGVVRFDTFSDKENERFDRECAGAIRRITAWLSEK